MVFRAGPKPRAHENKLQKYKKKYNYFLFIPKICFFLHCHSLLKHMSFTIFFGLFLSVSTKKRNFAS